MPMHVIHMRPAIFHIRFEILANITTRSNLIKYLCLKFRKEIEYFIPLLA